MAVEIGKLQVEQFFRSDLLQTALADQNLVYVKEISGFPQAELAQGTYFYLTLIDGDTAEVVKVVDVNTSARKLTLEENLTNTFSDQSARAEHWFTAQAFRDIQKFLEDLDTSGGSAPDNITIEDTGGELRVRTAGTDGTTEVGLFGIHIRDKEINNNHLQTDSVQSDQIKDEAVTEDKIDDSSVTSDKIRGNAVTFDKIQKMQTGKVLGNLTGIDAPPDEVDLPPDPGNKMGGGNPSTAQSLTHQFAVWNFAKNEDTKNREMVQTHMTPVRYVHADVIAASDDLNKSISSGSADYGELRGDFDISAFEVPDYILSDAQSAAGLTSARLSTITIDVQTLVSDTDGNVSGGSYVDVRYRYNKTGDWTTFRRIDDSGSNNRTIEIDERMSLRVPEGTTDIEIYLRAYSSDSSGYVRLYYDFIEMLYEWPVPEPPP